MISTREIADDKTTISSTRWAFATVIKFDIVIISLTLIAGLVGHFVGSPLDNGFYGSIAMLLGILTGLVTTGKALQGFEPHNTQSKADNISPTDNEMPTTVVNSQVIAESNDEDQ